MLQAKPMKLIELTRPIEPIELIQPIKQFTLPRAFESLNVELLNAELLNDYFAINVRSHIGKNIARAKKPTTAASPTVSSGPIASDSFFIEYSTSVS